MKHRQSAVLFCIMESLSSKNPDPSADSDRGRAVDEIATNSCLQSGLCQLCVNVYKHHSLNRIYCCRHANKMINEGVLSIDDILLVTTKLCGMLRLFAPHVDSGNVR